MGINFKEVGETQRSGDGFEPLPEGRYNLVVENAELTTASTGNEMIKTTFHVTDGIFINRKLWSNFVLTPKAYGFLFGFLRAAGSDLVTKEDVEPNEIADGLVGLKVSAYTEPGKTPNGNPTNPISKYKGIIEGEELTGASLFE
jgi:hypothetical protein